jgi:ribonuclease P protein subunit RPR2
MVKKPKNDVPNPNSVANRDIFQRLNFIYQASVLLNGIPDPSERSNSQAQSSGDDNERKRKRRRYDITAKDLSRMYVDSMQIVSKKTMVKMFVSHSTTSLSSGY